MIAGTLSRYFGWRFLSAVLIVFGGVVALIAMVDFIELMRRSSGMDVSTYFIGKISIYRVPYLTERIMPFAVLVGAMFCYLNLSRRLELVIARSAGVSAWQFITPAVLIAFILGVLATTLYNPMSATLREKSERWETELFRNDHGFHNFDSGFWVRQLSEDGQAIINARTSSRQGLDLGGVTILRMDKDGHFRDRIEARAASLQAHVWRLDDARIYAEGEPPVDRSVFEIKTNLTPAQVRESLATPDAVSFWQLPDYIDRSENAGVAANGYRVEYFRLLAQPFYLASMVLLAASVSLRLFRFGGVQKMVLSGIAAGFFLYILAKVTGDLSKAGLMPPVAAAGLPPLLGGLVGVITLLYQEDG
jgi:lipopolysaccharide export system permease protein